MNKKSREHANCDESYWYQYDRPAKSKGVFLFGLD